MITFRSKVCTRCRSSQTSILTAVRHLCDCMVMPGSHLTRAVKRIEVYSYVVIKNFKYKETEKIFNLESSRKIPPSIEQIRLRMLRMLHRSTSVTDLKIPPANRLEKLSGNRSGRWSIRGNDQWRICFEWHEAHAFRVEIVDYH